MRHTLGCALLCSALLPGALHAIVEDGIERRAIMPAQRQPGVDAPAVIELTDLYEEVHAQRRRQPVHAQAHARVEQRGGGRAKEDDLPAAAACAFRQVVMLPSLAAWRLCGQ